MRVTLYDASAEERAGLPLTAVSRVDVEVPSDWLVADVLQAGGHGGYNSFALATEDIETDVSVGEDHIIHASFNLLGVDDRGVVGFQGGAHVSWAGFLRASRAGLYEGDPTRLVVYPYGAAGGSSPDGLWELVQWLFENRDVAVGALEEVVKAGGGIAVIEAGRRWITGARRKQIAKQWRTQGFTAPRIRDYLARYPQWDAGQFATQTQLTEFEARLALTKAGYEEGEDGLWRSSESVEGCERRGVLAEIEERASADIENVSWSDDFPIDDEEAGEHEE